MPRRIRKWKSKSTRQVESTMAGPNFFQRLPLEVISEVVSFLDLESASNLRLTSREVAANVASAPAFLAYFHCKTISLVTVVQLRQFGPMTQPGRCGRAVRHLTLISGNSARCAEWETEAIELLRVAMENIMSSGKRGEGSGSGSPPQPLFAITLTKRKQEKSPESKNWENIWNGAAQAFRITAQAFYRSKLPLEALDVFGQPQWCSLDCGVFASTTNNLVTTPSSMHHWQLKRLSLSLSHHVTGDREDENREGLAAGRQHTQTFCDFVGLVCSSLEDLDLRWYKAHRGDTDALTDALREEQLLFDRLGSRQFDFPRLKTCSLRGFFTTGDFLFSFLKHCPALESLMLKEIHLGAGSFRSIFDHAVDTVKYLHFEDLYEDNWKMLYFNAPGKPNFPVGAPRHRPNNITRVGAAEVRSKPVRYSFRTGDIIGSPDYHRWIRRRAAMYGPPSLWNYPLWR
ncbi:hypothetical protein ABEF92_007788 [Exophiala dermatitidis]|uniref:F-box domain-containing protein n=2 Tax=Exophiala dermatitidis TaxID=5970 RepID=H6C4M1_EXODN|nr:uncharacterized protein HMPREF1120_06513 [Exophiala dermatitidis NIH/UT8656]EHY58503.1 hypothetical protein HMPREF1120_06513 [Exophiala dermatitidis NIH/UT8656]